jgi:predicted nucleotidyltransferase
MTAPRRRARENTPAMRREPYQQPPADVRTRLLDAARVFVLAASRFNGVKRISLLGSIVTDKRNPKDIDLLVQIADDVDMERLARLGRQLKGAAQQFNHSADVFLCDGAGRYLGRTCSWRDCRPGIRVSCDALHCGRRPYLHDDLANLCLKPSTVAKPPVELFPKIIRRCSLPADVERFISQLESPPPA